LTTDTRDTKNRFGAVAEALKGLYERRWLAAYFVQRQLAQTTKGSFLGFAWLFLTPLFMIILYTLVFSEIIGLRFQETDSVTNFGLYLYCGLIPFLALSDSLNKSVASIRGNSTLVQKVVFPLEILPMSTAVTAFVSQFFGLAGLIVLVAALERELHWTMGLLPLIMIPQLLFLLGLAYLVALIGTYLPDVKETLSAVARAMFFITPIIWPEELARDRGLGFLIDYNPLAFIVGAYRDFVLEGAIPDASSLLNFTLLSGALLVLGFLLFVWRKREFADLV
jgi:ABC-type polysaccharide/polyol phosphate export permease